MWIINDFTNHDLTSWRLVVECIELLLFLISSEETIRFIPCTHLAGSGMTYDLSMNLWGRDAIVQYYYITLRQFINIEICRNIEMVSSITFRNLELVVLLNKHGSKVRNHSTTVAR